MVCTNGCCVRTPKANGTVQIGVDLTKLNESVHRERHPLPVVGHIRSVRFVDRSQ